MQEMGQNAYLVTEVLTAPPQRLHLMLVEGAIRNARLAMQRQRLDQPVEADACLVRAQKITVELLNGLRPEVAPQLVDQMTRLYGFVLHNLLMAQLEFDPQLVEDAIAVLETEREAWRELCASELGAPAASGSSPPAAPLPPPTTGTSAVPPPHLSGLNLRA